MKKKSIISYVSVKKVTLMVFGVSRDPRQKIIILKQNNSFFFNKVNFTLFINVFTPHLCSFWMIYYIFYIYINICI